MQIYWLDTAKKQRHDLIDYILIKSDSEETAVKVNESIGNHVARLADHQKLGKPGRRRGTYELVHPDYGYVVIYQLRNKRIEILSILRGQQIQEPPK